VTAYPNLEKVPDYGFRGKIRATWRLVLALLWIFLCIPLQTVFCFLNLPVRYSFPRFFHRVVTCRILRMKITVEGKPAKDHPVFFLSNHLSYADIPVVSAVVATSFVSRAEVKHWPLLGLLAKLQHTVFVDRRIRHDAKNQLQNMKSFLREGHNLVLFPEGTSTDGTQVIPFKSTLMQAAFEQEDDITLQPLTIACVNEDGSQHRYPWYGDMDFPEHVWPFLQVPRFRMRLTFHDPVSVRCFENRKELADYAYKKVKSGTYGVKA
jgi:1-acyl-sn-glycerol-3-phosphate acyltransferase